MSLDIIFNIVKDLDKIPNVPFFTKSYIDEYLNIIQKHIPNCIIKKYENGTLIYLNNGSNTNNIVFHSHLDHPGFIINNSKLISSGAIFGEYNSNLKNINNSFKVDAYDVNGNFINTYTAKAISKVTAEFTENIDKSAVMAIPHGLSYSRDNNNLSARSLDNNLSTAIALNVLKNTNEHKKNIYLWISNVEEVSQISTYYSIKNKTLPDFFYNNNTEHIFLECAFPGEYLNYEYNKDFVEPGIEKGVIIRISDNLIPYGFKDNSAITKLANISKDYDNCYITPTGGSSDAKVFVVEGVSKNIAGLVIPCENKHNKGEGIFVSESALIKDIGTAYNILIDFIRSKEVEYSEVKHMFPDFSIDKQNITKIKKNLFRVYLRNYYKIKYKTAFPKNILHKFYDLIGKILAKLYF